MSKLLFIIAYIFLLYVLFGCRSNRIDNVYPDKQIQCSLVSYNYVTGVRAEITATTYRLDTISIRGIFLDTVYLLYGWRGAGRINFWPNMKLTAEYNSNVYKIVNGKRFYPSRIRINQ